MIDGIVVVVALAGTVALVDTVVETALDLEAATCRVLPDVLQPATSATQLTATVTWPRSVPALLAIDTCAAGFIRTYELRLTAR